MKTSVINQIKTLLGMEVKLETMKLMDGITVFEADTFEMDKEVFIVTEDEQKIPVPIGEYELEDGRILVVEDSSLQNITFRKHANVKASNKISRNVGLGSRNSCPRNCCY